MATQLSLARDNGLKSRYSSLLVGLFLKHAAAADAVSLHRGRRKKERVGRKSDEEKLQFRKEERGRRRRGGGGEEEEGWRLC